MTAWLASLLERLPPPVRRVAVAVLALLVLGAVAVILTPPSGVAPRSERAPTRPAPTTGPARGRPRLPSPVPAVQLVQARRVAERFLASYLPFAYGRTRAGSVGAVTPGLRGELIRERAQVTPVELRRHPRVTSLQVTGQAEGLVLATAMIEDGGITTYTLRFTLERRAGGWAVSSVDDG